MKDQTIVIEQNINQQAVSSLKEMSLKYLESIEKLKREIKEANEMLKDALAGDAAYHDASEKAKEADKKRQVEKKRVQSRPEMVSLALKVKDLKSELREKKQSLSDYLLEYERLSGKQVIEKPSGEQLSIFKT